jgi:hypothetical protein
MQDLGELDAFVAMDRKLPASVDAEQIGIRLGVLRECDPAPADARGDAVPATGRERLEAATKDDGRGHLSAKVSASCSSFARSVESGQRPCQQVGGEGRWGS